MRENKPPILRFSAARDIKRGEEIFIAYMSPETPREERIAKLKRVYRFECACSRCSNVVVSFDQKFAERIGGELSRFTIRDNPEEIGKLASEVYEKVEEVIGYKLPFDTVRPLRSFDKLMPKDTNENVVKIALKFLDKFQKFLTSARCALDLEPLEVKRAAYIVSRTIVGISLVYFGYYGKRFGRELADYAISALVYFKQDQQFDKETMKNLKDMCSESLVLMKHHTPKDPMIASLENLMPLFDLDVKEFKSLVIPMQGRPR
jgi:hypothetical protein